MAGLTDNSSRFEVSCSALVAQKLRKLQRRASDEGRGKELVAAFRTIFEKLRHDPLHTGEACYRLPALRLQVRSVAVRPLVVDFGVSEDRPIVYLKAVKLLAAPS